MKNFWAEEIEDQDVGIEMPRFGLCLGGDESTMIRAARIAAKSAGGKAITYVEIGLAEGVTFTAMADVFVRIGVDPSRLKVVGIDIENGWSLDKKLLDENSGTLKCQVELSFIGSVDFLKAWDKEARGPIHFIFIDGCHERECAKLDFILAEPLIAEGGIAVFHDSDEMVQGTDCQRHNKQPIGVRPALDDLELLSGKRDGWVKLADIEGLPNHRGIAVFKKTNLKGE
jgi:predicted O-methyltransferase YrrM